LTTRLAARTAKCSEGIGETSSRDAALSSEGSSQACHSSESANATGMRWWIDLTSSFAWPVMIVQLATTTPSGEVQRAQRPAKQNGAVFVSEK
jgi:hypothetical protein